MVLRANPMEYGRYEYGAKKQQIQVSNVRSLNPLRSLLSWDSFMLGMIIGIPIGMGIMIGIKYMR